MRSPKGKRVVATLKKLDGKVAVITGAGSGIGRASALLFAQEGAKIAVVDYAPAGGQETVKKVRDSGGEAVFIEADVSKAADAERMVKTAVETFGKLDILFNNAGVAGKHFLVAEYPEDDWDRVLSIDLKSVFLCSKYAIREMLKAGRGVIINTASTAGFVGGVTFLAYAAAKAGIINLTKTMALEYGRKNIRVNCLCPGLVQTPLTERVISVESYRQMFLDSQQIARIGEPEDIAPAALYLASDDSSFVTGATLVVDGGFLLGGQ